MTVHRPVQVLLMAAVVYVLLILLLSLVLSELATTVIAVAGIFAVIGGFIVYTIFYEGQPPESALPVLRTQIIDVKSTRVKETL